MAGSMLASRVMVWVMGGRVGILAGGAVSEGSGAVGKDQGVPVMGAGWPAAMGVSPAMASLGRGWSVDEAAGLPVGGVTAGVGEVE